MCIQNKALLVSLSIKKWSGTRTDKNVSREIEAAHGATLSGRYEKSLVADKAIKMINKKANKIRSFHYDHTLPWNDGGVRILPAAAYLAYTQGMKTLISDFQNEVDTFTRNYTALVREAEKRLNGMFNPNDYPLDIESMFNVEIDFEPVPKTADWRVDLDSREVQELQTALETTINNRQKRAVRDLHERAGKVLRSIVDRLSDSENVFRDSLIENVRDLVQLFPILNFQNDPELDKLQKELSGLIQNVNPELIRQNHRLRRETAEKADDILSRFGI